MNLPAPRPHTSGYLLAISLVAALGGLLFGFDTAVIAGTLPFLRAHFTLSDEALGWAVSSVLIGCMAGTVVAGWLSDRFGRKRVLLGTASFFALSSVGTALAGSLGVFVAARVLGGIAIGTASMLSPVYIAEVAPAHVRGRLVSLNQLAVVTGILLSSLSNYLLSPVGPDAWRWMLGVGAAPAFAFLAALLAVPETPRWLVRQGLREEARRVLGRIHGEAAAADELGDIARSLADAAPVRLADLAAPRLRPVLLVGILLAMLQQFTGINTVMYYAPMIFQAAGAGTSSALLQTVAVGAVNLLCTLLAIWLIDRVGRRALLLAGAAAMAVFLALLAAEFHLHLLGGTATLLLVLAYIAAFATTFGPITWVVIAEIFPNRVRGLAASAATFALWLACFVVSLTFPISLARLGGSVTFAGYAVLCALGYLFVWYRLPETRGKTLEEIERELVPPTHTVSIP